MVPLSLPAERVNLTGVKVLVVDDEAMPAPWSSAS